MGACAQAALVLRAIVDALPTKKAAPGGGYKVALKEPQGNKTVQQRHHRADAYSVPPRYDSGVT